MYQIDNSTAVAAIPASTALGTIGYFTDGNPATGVPATIMPSEFMNMLMMENLNVLAAAGITPVKNQFNQLALAIAKIVQNGAAGAASETSAGILKLATSALATAGVDNTTAITPQKLAAGIQTQAFTAFTSAGTAPAFTLTPSPAITAYAANQRFQVAFAAAGGAAPTLNVSGIGPKNLKQYTATGVKIAAVIAAGQTSDVFYDGTDLVVLDQLPNSSGVTPSQFDNSTNLATTAFVQGVGLQFSSLVLATASITLTAASHAGALIVGNSASAINVTLPLAATIPAKTVIKFWNFNSGAMTIVCAGSDAIYSPSGGTTFSVPQGSYVTLASNGTAAWFAIENSTQGVTPAQFNGSTALATTAFVQGVGFQFSGVFTPTANTTLTAATHAGSVIIANSASLLTITLPASSTMPSKTAIKFWSYGAGGMTVTAAGSDSIYLPATNTTFPVPQGAWVTLVSNGASGWYAVDMAGAGVGQVATVMGGARVAGTTYTNSTGKPKYISVIGTNDSTLRYLIVGGVNAGQFVPIVSGSISSTVSALIPPGATFSVTSGLTIVSWVELIG